MNLLQILVLLLAVAVLLTWWARRIGIPYPIVLVVGGALLGFIPGLPTIPFDPTLILALVLPPILYGAAYNISMREFKQQIRAITLLAVGLVIATTLVVGAVLKWLIPDIPWAIAFAFGAIVSPPDAVAATAIFSRARISRMLRITLEGESLLNDATGLVLYKFAVAAALTGLFSFSEATGQFIIVAIGGLLLGYVLGRLLNALSAQLRDPTLQIVISLVIPYVIYLLAEALHISGVLAVVAAGLVGARMLSQQFSAEARILGWSTWEVLIILLDSLVFILVGSQLRGIVERLPDTTSFMTLITWGIALTLVAFAVRMIWIFPGAYLPRWIDEKWLGKKVVYPPWQNVVIAGWCGMRGIVSLAAALALPYTLHNGAAFPYRDLIIFLTFIVTFLTLVIPGLTLAPLMRWLKVGGDIDSFEEQRVARERTIRAALTALAALHQSQELTTDIYQLLKADYEARLNHALPSGYLISYDSDPYFKGRRAAVAAERRRLIELWRASDISDEVLHMLERELDYEEARYR